MIHPSVTLFKGLLVHSRRLALPSPTQCDFGERAPIEIADADRAGLQSLYDAAVDEYGVYRGIFGQH